VLGVTAVGLVVAVATTLSMLDDGKDDPGGVGASPSASTGSTSSAPVGPGSTPAAGGSAPAAAGAVTAVAIGARVPAQGTVRLGVGEIRQYRLRLDAAREVYLEGEVCADLVPWRLFRAGGGLVSDGLLGCRQFGPLTLAAGDYDLRVGGRGVEGRYAFTLSGR
jgi:hypothetical protein